MFIASCGPSEDITTTLATCSLCVDMALRVISMPLKLNGCNTSVASRLMRGLGVVLLILLFNTSFHE